MTDQARSEAISAGPGERNVNDDGPLLGRKDSNLQSPDPESGALKSGSVHGNLAKTSGAAAAGRPAPERSDSWRLPTGLCRGCGKPHYRASHALWCLDCARDAKNAHARIARRRREGKEEAPYLCEGCGQPTGRHHSARFCLVCKMLRQRARNRTQQYKSYQEKYRHSAKRKNGVAEWNERNKERLRAQNHLGYLRRKLARGPKYTPCATLNCEGKFVRPKASRRMFCEDCQRAFFGASYVRGLKRRIRPLHGWGRAA